MTEPLIVDTDRLDAASASLKAAAEQIPTQLPQFSVTGSDPLSMAIARGALQVEEPMAALPALKAEAITVAENIGVAGKRYRETDEMLAQKARQQQFDKDDGHTRGATGRGTHGGGIGKYKASPTLAKDLPPLTDEVADDVTVSDVVGATGDGMQAEAKTSKTLSKGVVEVIGGAGKLLARTSKIADFTETVSDMYNDVTGPNGAHPLTAAADHVPKLGLQLGAGALGAEGGAVAGAALGTMIFPGVGTVIGAGLGAFAGGLLASEGGEAAGEAMSEGIHAFAAADSFVDAWATVPGTLGKMVTSAGERVWSIFGG